MRQILMRWLNAISEDDFFASGKAINISVTV